MKKTFGLFSAIWLIFFVIFNMIVFIIANESGGITNINDNFLTGYIFITISFLGHLLCILLWLRSDDKQKTFYNIPIMRIGYIGLIVMLVAGTVCMAIPALPIWLGITICALVLAFTILATVKALYATSVVSDIDQQTKAKTFFIKSLTAEAERLMNTSKTTELKALAKKVYEAIRYSDPTSNEASARVEEKIQLVFSNFDSAVANEDLELASSVADELLSLVDIRNKSCKLLK